MAIKRQVWLTWLQETADLTGQPTTLWLSHDVLRLQLTGWPMQGTLLAQVEPRRGARIP